MIFSSKKSYELYIFYIALKRHFTSDYDVTKYNGKVNASQEAFESRSDIINFYKLSKKSNAKKRILAHLIKDPNTWIGDILEYDDIYYEWKNRNNSLSRTIETDLKKYDMSLKDMFSVKSGNHPFIFKQYMADKVSPETLSLIDKSCQIFKVWDSKILDDIIYPDVVFKLRKYQPFLNIDPKKVKEILKSL